MLFMAECLFQRLYLKYSLRIKNVAPGFGNLCILTGNLCQTLLNGLLDFVIFVPAKEKRRQDMITAKGICKSFADKQVLSGIDLDIKPGTVFPEYHMGTIEVFDNVFIGTGSLILNGVKIGPNAIVAAGSVVTKDVPEGTIVGGNPAKVIGTVDNFIEKRKKMMDRPIDRDPLSKIMKYYWGEKH